MNKKWMNVAGASVFAVALVAGGGAIGTAVVQSNIHAQQVVAAERAMAAAAPAYLGEMQYGAQLDSYKVQSVEAKQAYDAEQARLAAEKAAQEAAAKAAAEEAARQAALQAQQAAEQQAQDETYSDDSEGTTADPAPAPSEPTKCPAGTHANAVDANGNESACEADGPNGEHCQAYDENNNCTAWLKE